MSGHMNLTLKVWRQKNINDKGQFVTIQAKDIADDMSFLEMLDVVNEDLTRQGEDPIYFDHDCREGICGMCSLVINGRPHGPKYGITTCQLHMRSFHDGQTIVIEPWRAAAFPVLKDLAVDRTSFDRIQQAGGYVNINTGGVPDANTILFLSVLQMRLLNRQLVSDVEHVWRPVKMLPLCYSYRPRFHNSHYCHKDKLNVMNVLRQWLTKWTQKVSVTVQILELVKRNVQKALN